jgi:hypothetical protein
LTLVSLASFKATVKLKRIIFVLMRLRKEHYIIFTILFFGATFSQAQTSRYSKNNKPITAKSKRSKASIECPIFDERGYPYQGLGFKLGDPFALTYKFYATRNLALAIDAGKTASGLYNKYYQNAFDDYKPDSLTSSQSLQEISHKVTKDVFLEGKILYQWNAEKLSRGLQVYAGIGWQWRNATLIYDYLLEDNSSGSVVSTLGQTTQTRYTYGPVGVLGFEYAYFSIPISAFIEIEWFYDTGLDPGYNRFQGGVGLRYVFK